MKSLIKTIPLSTDFHVSGGRLCVSQRYPDTDALFTSIVLDKHEVKALMKYADTWIKNTENAHSSDEE